MSKISLSTNLSVELNFNTTTIASIDAIVGDICRKADRERMNREEVLESTLFRVGINDFHNTLCFTAQDVYDSGTYPTIIGDLVLRGTRCYDYSDYGVDITAGFKPADDEVEVSYGSPHYGYVAIAPLNRECPKALLKAVKTAIETSYHRVAPVVEEELRTEKKSWGSEKNTALKEAGCDTVEIQAWWRMAWKKEWQPEEWAAFCNKYKNIQIEAAMAATGHRYLEAVGIGGERSFPRKMDAIETLGKARGLKKRYWKEWKNGGTLVPPVVGDDGIRTWSF